MDSDTTAMYSIAFPDIFNGSTINLNKDYYAIKTNLKSLLMSNKGGLFGDPNYGVNIKKILWNQEVTPLQITPPKNTKVNNINAVISEELLKDDIATAIYSYLPQISITRDDIDVKLDGNVVYASISVTADPSIPSDLFNIKILFETE